MPKKEKCIPIDVDVEPLKKRKSLDVEIEDANTANKSSGDRLMELFRRLTGEEKVIEVPTEYGPTVVPTFYDQVSERRPESAPKPKSEEGPGKPHEVSDAPKVAALQRMMDVLKKSDFPKDKNKREALEELMLKFKGSK